jgi:hypothetical protein
LIKDVNFENSGKFCNMGTFLKYWEIGKICGNYENIGKL